MVELSPAIELALRCDDRGLILSVERSPPGAGASPPGGALSPGAPFAVLITAESAAAALDFLFTLRQDGVVLGQELAVRGPGDHRLLLRFAGIALDRGYRVVASRGRAPLVRFLRSFASSDGAGGDATGEGTGAVPEQVHPGARKALADLLAREEGSGDEREMRTLLRLARRLLHRLLRAELPPDAAQDATRLRQLCQRMLTRIDS